MTDYPGHQTSDCQTAVAAADPASPSQGRLMIGGRLVAGAFRRGVRVNLMARSHRLTPIASADAPESIIVTDDKGQPVDSITVRVDETKRLNISVLPAAASQEFTATVDDKTVAALTVDGMSVRVTALKPGPATVKLTAGTVVKSVPVTVTQSSPNLWPSIPSRTVSGITMTNNGDGSYTFTGTNTAGWKNFSLDSRLEAGTYRVSLDRYEKPSVVAYIRYKGGSFTVSGTPREFTLTSAGYVTCQLSVQDYAALANYTVTPLLVKTD